MNSPIAEEWYSSQSREPNQKRMTLGFLQVASSLTASGAAPYKSSHGAPAWSLCFYGAGARFGAYRTTLFLDENGLYTHLLLSPDGEMEVQRSGLEDDPGKLTVNPSMFVDSTVLLEDGGFKAVPRRDEELLSILTQSLSLISDGYLPPVFDFTHAVSGEATP